MHEAFGLFSDVATSMGVELDSNTCSATLELIKSMSESYMNTPSTKRGSEKERARILREHFLPLITGEIGKVLTLEPTSVSLVRREILSFGREGVATKLRGTFVWGLLRPIFSGVVILS